ncbi:MAG: amidohydrolase family protein, partial [Clostridia bacterium]
GDCTVKFLKTPVELLEDYGFLDRFSTLYHCVHMDKDDVTLLSHYGANIVTCPSSNLKLGSGFAPIYSFQNADLNIAIGTDSAASNNSLDMFKEMFLAATLPKACLYDSSVISCKDVLKMATINGAKALGIERIGKIEEGFFADLILIDTTKAHFWPKNNLISNLVYSAKSSDVYLTMINGKIVYESGEFKTCKDFENVFQNCEKIVKRIKGNVENEY